MDSFDQSLKYLAQREPADFIRFALRDPTVQVLGPLPSDLPTRGRDIDGCYFIDRGAGPEIAHLEFHRRHQKLDDLAVDVAEAQIRLYRREHRKVVSLVWDLYGSRGAPLIEARTLDYGVPVAESKGSQATYLRVNLQGIGWRKLLAEGPPALWPLVALTDGGASEEAVHQARDAIGGRPDLSPAQKADHVAVLWFVAEAEDVPVRVMKAYITENDLMASMLYREIFEKGELKGEAKRCAETIIRVLTRWMGSLDAALREKLRSLSDLDTLDAWYEEVLFIDDARHAEMLAEKIRKVLLPPP